MGGLRAMSPTVLITGSSSGVGKATALHFAGRGWNVSATARDPATTTSWATAANLFSPRLDVTDDDSIATAVAATVSRFGSVDVLVNNAGFEVFGPLEGIGAELLESQFRANLFGAAATIRHVLPGMRERRSGTIINVSS